MGGGRRVGGEEGRRGRPPSGVEVRVECEAAAVGEQGGEGDQVRPLTVPVLVQPGAGGGEEGGAGALVGAAHAAGGLPQCERQSDRLERLGRRQAGEGAAAPASAAAPFASEGGERLLAPQRRGAPRRRSLERQLLLPPSPRSSTLVFFEVAAEDKRVGGGEGTLSAAKSLARRVLQLLVQVEVVLALAAIGAAVAVEGPLARVHAHMLNQLIGRLGQVATLLTLVVVAQPVGAHVSLQGGLVGPQSLTDAAAVLQLTVRLKVALQGRWTRGGIDAEGAPG